ncbi:MAG: DEAD/DEAH box helicase, partial [Candidatus Magasanikbacteria bacterium]|nr:DEAD/DEAH box helicase [Candidatus Magasanikbacteria bacterium]
MSLKLETSITQVAGVGEVLSSKLKRLGIYTVRDLLYYFPFRYEDFSQVSSISDLQSGQLVTIAVQIEMIGAKRSPRRRLVLTEAVVTDDSDRLKVIWFNQPFIAKTLKVGDKIFLSGKVTVDRFGLSLQNPSYERMKEETVHTARLVPLYPLTEGITQKQIRFFISEIIGLSDATTEWIPKELLEKNKLLALSDALRGIHFPKSQEELTHCLERLKFDELFVLQLRAEMLRQELARVHAPQIKFAIEPVKEFVARLPFELTKDQRVAAWEIFQDIEKGEPMNRLLEGDVGSGKTAVAALALFLTAHNGFQGAIMAPTEILANQHLETLQKMFAHTDISIALVTHSQVAKKSERTKIYEAIKNGEITITIGTHALLSEGVEFKNLGLVIVDEQHRFGVTQRKTMKEKSGLEKAEPHFLSMTATPIPRSLALTLYGDLDVSQLRVKPAGR